MRKCLVGPTSNRSYRAGNSRRSLQLAGLGGDHAAVNLKRRTPGTCTNISGQSWDKTIEYSPLVPTFLNVGALVPALSRKRNWKRLPGTIGPFLGRRPSNFLPHGRVRNWPAAVNLRVSLRWDNKGPRRSVRLSKCEVPSAPTPKSRSAPSRRRWAMGMRQRV